MRSTYSRSLAAFLGGLLGSLLLSSCDGGGEAAKPGIEAPNVLVTVEDEPITTDRFVEWLESSRLHSRRRVDTVEAKEALLSRLIDDFVVETHARRAGYAERPEVRKLVRDAIVEQYLRDRLHPKLQAIEVSEEEIQGFYEKNRNLYQVDRRVLPALIYVRRPKDRDEGIDRAARERVAKAREAALKLPKSVPHFGEVAKEFSDDSKSRINGGEIGWITDGSIPGWLEEPVSDAAFTLAKVGAVSEVVETERAFYLIKLVDQRDPETRSIGSVRDSIKTLLKRRKKEDMQGEFLSTLRNELEIKRAESLRGRLEKIAVPSPSDAKRSVGESREEERGTSVEPSSETIDKAYQKFREVSG